MKIEFRNQLESGETRSRVYEGWKAAVIGGLVVLGIIALIAFLLPIFLFGILMFLSFIFFMMIAGWIYLCFKIGWRNMWELTKFFFGWRRSSSWLGHWGRVKSEYESRKKARYGEWIK